MKDLIVLCADSKIEATIKSLLARPAALGIRPIEFESRVFVGRYDSGCFLFAREFLQPYVGRFEHALVVFDKSWDGAPASTAQEMASVVEQKLLPDWRQRAGAVVIDPELEAWVWSDSPHVAGVLGWSGRRQKLRQWLESQGLWEKGTDKPHDPKLAVERTMRKTGTGWTSGRCNELASKVSVDRCTDNSFRMLKEILSKWFGKTGSR